MAGFDPFEDDEIVIDGGVNDRTVAIEEEKQRATQWLSTRTTQTNKYIAALDKQIADLQAGNPVTEIPFRFENYGATSSTPNRQASKRPAPKPSGNGGRFAAARSYSTARNWAIIVGVLVGLAGILTLFNFNEFAPHMAVILFLIFVIVGGLFGYGVSRLVEYWTAPKTS